MWRRSDAMKVKSFGKEGEKEREKKEQQQSEGEYRKNEFPRPFSLSLSGAKREKYILVMYKYIVSGSMYVI